ncbi:MAG: hypothetical protein ACRDZN_00330 [Acidimicrobiales bacterium]
MPHPDLDDEQAYVDDAYRCLAAMRERTRRATAIADGAAQAVDSAIAQAHLAHRLGSLDDDVTGLSFGRLDGDGGDRWYVGRRHVEDAHGDPVVVDWRADVAVPFYRATAVDPLDLRRRRRFVMTGRSIDDLCDEVFDDPDSVDAAHHGGIPDPLLAELERERTGEMRDIVATIAAEQDKVIRAPLETCLVVQGGPGTGKTEAGLEAATAWGTVRLPDAAVTEAVVEVQRRGVPHNVGRMALRTQLARLVRQELVARRGDEVAHAEEVDASLRASRHWQRALDRLWPQLNAAGVVRRLLGNGRSLRAAAAGVLEPGEQALLARSSARRVSDEPWAVDDLALLDEAEALVTGSPRGYGHVVVDEAQDLSAMDFRALSRRSPTRPR